LHALNWCAVIWSSVSGAIDKECGKDVPHPGGLIKHGPASNFLKFMRYHTVDAIMQSAVQIARKGGALKIRSQITILLAAAAVVMPFVAGMALIVATEFGSEMREMGGREDFIGSITQLRHAAVETILFHEERAQAQWSRTITAIKAELERMPVRSAGERAIIERMRKNIALAQVIYPRLMDAYAPASGAAQPQQRRVAADVALEARTITSLFGITGEVIDGGYEMIRLDREESATILHWMQFSIGLVILAMGVLIAFIWRVVGYRILRPLRNFEAGTRQVAAGDYSHRLNLRQDDEIGVLAAAFDVMTAHVQQTQDALVAEAANSRRAEADLQESAQYTQAILDNVVDAIITIDGGGIIQSANRAVEAIFGYAPAALIGHNIKMLMPEPYQSEHDGYLASYLQTGIARVIGGGREVDGLHKDGRRFPIDLAVSHSVHRGQPLFIGLVRDISERHRVEKMKTEFVSTVSHELRTPLTSISGSLGLVVGGALGEAPSKMRAMLDIAHKNSLRLSHLIDDLLDMEKLVEGKIRFDLQVQALMPLIEQAVESTRAYGEKLNVSFCVSERADQVQVRVDGDRLQQVMSNFLSNAAKFSPPGEQVQISVRQEGKVVRVVVTDHGAGIPLEFCDRIFQKFSQADSSNTRQKGGTGLGLAITKELIERMNGLVGFSSEPGAGASFHFELPLALEPHAGSPGSGEVDAADGGAPSLLVVEDEPDIAALLAFILRRAGYRVDVAHDGDSAMQYLAQRRYAAITLDLMLPDQSGVLLMRRIRANINTEKLPIIVISAYTTEGKLAVSGEFNAIDWMAKPIQEADLVRAVARAIQSRVGRRHVAANALAKSATQLPVKCRVLHIEDDADLSGVVAALGQDVAEFSIARDLREARAKLAQGSYQVVVLDVGLPDGSGWELLPQLRALTPPPAVIVLSGADSTQQQRAAVRAVLMKSAGSTDELLALLRVLGADARA
jgi:PAS domain S-box-containing protein